MNASHFADYASRLRRILAEADWRPVQALAEGYVGHIVMQQHLYVRHREVPQPPQ
jgi:hypothetical protein